jgi:hypothetical protein
MNQTPEVPAGTRFTFDRKGEPKVDPVREYIALNRDGRRFLGEVVAYYRDGDETPSVTVKHFNGEPWPFDPPLAVVEWIKQGVAS